MMGTVDQQDFSESDRLKKRPYVLKEKEANYSPTAHTLYSGGGLYLQCDNEIYLFSFCVTSAYFNGKRTIV
jgi:hypothetical protein